MKAETMTDAERAAEKARKEGLAAEMASMTDEQLADLATRAEVDAKAYPKRKDLIAAIELKAEADAAVGRQALREADEAQKKAVEDEDARRPAPSRIIVQLNAEFCRDMPEAARSSGAFEPDDGDPRFGGDYNVQNGKYRVVGSDWLFLIAGKRLVSAERATEANKWGGKAVIQVD
jgi:hypothetical protein